MHLHVYQNRVSIVITSFNQFSHIQILFLNVFNTRNSLYTNLFFCHLFSECRVMSNQTFKIRKRCSVMMSHCLFLHDGQDLWMNQYFSNFQSSHRLFFFIGRSPLLSAAELELEAVDGCGVLSELLQNYQFHKISLNLYARCFVIK